MAKVRPGKAYEMFIAERARLESALESAKLARWEAEKVENSARIALEKLAKFEADPVSWASGDAGERSTGLLHGFVRFSCGKCGASGSSADGRCVNCEESSDGAARNLVNIYQSV